LADATEITIGYEGRLAQGTLAFPRFFGKNMAFIRLFPFDFSGTCHFKALFGTAL
jgi:hypothetical protein